MLSAELDVGLFEDYNDGGDYSDGGSDAEGLEYQFHDSVSKYICNICIYMCMVIIVVVIVIVMAI